MKGHGDDDRFRDGRGLAPAVALVSSEEANRGPVDTDLIFDFEGIQAIDVKSLSLILTAQQVADQDSRTVWLAGLPERVWNVFRAMGLDEYFREFPGLGDASA